MADHGRGAQAVQWTVARCALCTSGLPTSHIQRQVAMFRVFCRVVQRVSSSAQRPLPVFFPWNACASFPLFAARVRVEAHADAHQDKSSHTPSGRRQGD
eukprot:6203543-Pleurochrysis_carterae.AAC.3